MASRIKNLNVASISPLDPPSEYLAEIPTSKDVEELVFRSRQEIADIVAGRDERLVVVTGPCSIHDEIAGREYAERLAVLSDEIKDNVMVVMRVYFEKPRTTVGWKGLINDPNLDGTCNMAEGLRRARQFLMDVCEIGLPCATEFLDPFTPQYIADLISWGAIGARTAESQTHRQLASGLSMPIGFKNGTGGSIQLAVDGMIAAQRTTRLPRHRRCRCRGSRTDVRERRLPHRPARRVRPGRTTTPNTLPSRKRHSWTAAWSPTSSLTAHTRTAGKTTPNNPSPSGTS